MKKFLLALALTLNTACAALGGPSQPVAGVSATHVALEATDALSKASDAYAGVSFLAEKVVRQDVLTAGQLGMLRTLSNRAVSLLDGADSSLTAAERASSVFLIITQIHSILGK